MIAVEHLREASRRRVARAIGELTFEGLIDARPIGEGEYAIELSEALHWRLRGRSSAWGGVHVEPGTVLRCVEGQVAEPLDSLGQVILDARHRLGASNEVLAEWLEEINASVLAEAGHCERLATTSASELARLGGVALEQHLDGHPKLIAHRGRAPWGLDELRAHAPEFGATLQLDWLVVAPELARTSGLAGAHERPLLDESCDASERDRLGASLHARAPALEREGVLVPVHPWQLRRWLATQYVDTMARGAMVPLGRFGDRYAPRLSIRTLANLDRPDRCDLKLALSILNTSCWRGLPGRHVEQGGVIGAALRGLVEADPILREAGVRVLVDRGGVHVAHAEFEALTGGPYRLREQCAAIWRESAAGRLRADELEVPAAALHQCDRAGDSLLRHYVERSGSSLEAWLQALFERSAVPLDHLLCAHDIGVIAHGQNLGLVLREGLPVALLLRDVHGDVRRASERSRTGPLAQLPTLPREQLLHDLYTGYFVSVLRFVAPLIDRDFGMRESTFLGLLARALHRARAARSESSEAFDLFRPTMPRICLNRARLRVNHGGGEQRPLPELGPVLHNPLAMKDEQDE